jgi:hypothetical protein
MNPVPRSFLPLTETLSSLSLVMISVSSQWWSENKNQHRSVLETFQKISGVGRIQCGGHCITVRFPTFNCVCLGDHHDPEF